MYAALILSQSPYGVRQIAFVPTSNGDVRVFSRCGFGRGLGATWTESSNSAPVPHNEYSINSPVSVLMTDAHIRDANIAQRTPNNVLQALGNRIADTFIPNTTMVGELYEEVYNLVISNSPMLAQYAHKQVVNVTTMPVLVTAPVAVPAAVVSEPEPQPVNYQAVIESTPVGTPVKSVHAAKRETNVLTIPDIETYYERVFDDIPESVIYDKSRANSWNVLLTGDAGTGKTSSARNYAATRQLPFVVVECTQQIDNTVTQGRFVPDEDGTSLKWVYSRLATAIQQPSVILLNELSRMHPKSASLFLTLLAERVLLIDTFNEVIEVHPECLIIADANMGSDYNGAMRQDPALLDRFAVKLPFTYDIKLEQNFLPFPSLLEFANSIRVANEMGEEDYSVPMSTRLLQNFVSHVRHFNWSFAVNRLLANFPSDNGERNSIKLRLEADAPRIAGEFGIALTSAMDNN